MGLDPSPLPLLLGRPHGPLQTQYALHLFLGDGLPLLELRQEPAPLLFPERLLRGASFSQELLQVFQPQARLLLQLVPDYLDLAIPLSLLLFSEPLELLLRLGQSPLLLGQPHLGHLPLIEPALLCFRDPAGRALFKSLELLLGFPPGTGFLLGPGLQVSLDPFEGMEPLDGPAQSHARRIEALDALDVAEFYARLIGGLFHWRVKPWRPLPTLPAGSDAVPPGFRS